MGWTTAGSPIRSTASRTASRGEIERDPPLSLLWAPGSPLFTTTGSPSLSRQRAPSIVVRSARAPAARRTRRAVHGPAGRSATRRSRTRAPTRPRPLPRAGRSRLSSGRAPGGPAQPVGAGGRMGERARGRLGIRERRRPARLAQEPLSPSEASAPATHEHAEHGLVELGDLRKPRRVAAFAVLPSRRRTRSAGRLPGRSRFVPQPGGPQS